MELNGRSFVLFNNVFSSEKKMAWQNKLEKLRENKKILAGNLAWIQIWEV
jgi:hypothetical protein